jgi:putative intracellular protease/amidase
MSSHHGSPLRWTSLLALAAGLACAVGSAALRPAQEPAPEAPPALKKVGILVYPGVEVIDFAGPYEVLSSVFFEGRKVFDVVTVGPGPGTLRTSPGFEGLRLTPDFTLDDCPKLDLLLVPGGEIGSVTDDPKSMEWIARTAQDAECVMSVCNGAFILAKGGHLAHQSATTFYYFIDQLKEDEPTCTPVHDQRFVDNGKIITAAGLSSGIDAALHLVERYTNRYTAEQRALGLEYHWQPDSPWTRGNLADRHYIRMVGAGFDFADGAVEDWTTVENSGTEAHWTKRWTFRSALDRAALLAVLEAKPAASWKKTAAEGDSSVWAFADDKGRPWTARLTLTRETDWKLALEIDRR